jgi:alkylation response protein AidB-like acyl-CoA dehydrogenase
MATTTETPAPATLSLVPSAEEAALRETVSRIGADFGHEYFMRKARAGESVSELWHALGEKGFLGVCLPEEYGGGGLGMWALSAVSEELAAIGCPLIPVVFSQAICGNLLAKYGTDEQKDEWLEGIATGESLFSFALTEPDAGSNSHNLATTARRENSKYVLRGTKTFISGVEDADQVVVAAKTGETEKGRGLLSLFVVDPESPGLERQHVPTALEAPEKQWMLFFDDVEVEADRLLGTENEGLKALFDGLNPERIIGAAFCIGIGRYALDKAARYVNERVVWDVPIGAHQGVAHPLAEAKIELESARLMNEKAARLYDAGLPAGEAANMAKFLAGEAGVHCLDRAIQVHGGNGLALEYGLTEMWWLVRLLKIAPVSREMVLNYVAEHSLGLPKSY